MRRTQSLLSGLIVWRYLQFSGVNGFDFGCIDAGVWIALSALPMLKIPTCLFTFFWAAANLY